MQTLQHFLDGLWQLLMLPSRLGALRRPAIRAVLLRQLLFTGWQALPTVLMVGSAVGLILAVQLQAFLGGNSAVTFRALNTALFIELGPLLTGVVLVARSGSAVATELASMRVNGETRSLESLGIRVEDYLVLPRVLAAALCGPCLCLYLQLAALASAAIVVLMNGGQALGVLLPEVLSAEEVLWSMAKASLFSGWVIAMTCKLGLSTAFTQNAVPVAASRAVMNSILGLFLLDGLLALLSRAGAALA